MSLILSVRVITGASLDIGNGDSGVFVVDIIINPGVIAVDGVVCVLSTAPGRGCSGCCPGNNVSMTRLIPEQNLQVAACCDVELPPKGSVILRNVTPIVPVYFLVQGDIVQGFVNHCIRF